MAALEESTTVIIILLVIQQITMATGETASVCLNSLQRTLPLRCGTGYMLYVTKAFYGYSELGTCSFTPGDCTQAEHEAYPCTGQDYCNINLPTGGFGQKLTNCDRYNAEKYSTYFQVEYFCQPVIQTTDICTTNILTQQSGFIATPQYPKTYPESKDCLVQISVHPTQKINLTIIDMDLEINGTFGCHDWMYAFNQIRSVTLCGRRANEKLTTLGSNEISIRFQSDNKTNKKGFWIYYEAYPPLPTTQPNIITEKPTTKKIEPPVQENNNNEVQDIITNKPTNVASKSSSQNDEEEPKQKLPFVAIVAGVIGSLTFILIVLLMLLVYRWYNDKQPYRVKSQHVEYLDARNPAFRSSTGTEFQGIEIYYNC